MDVMAGNHLEDVFRTGMLHWEKNSESLSGPGSSLQYTEHFRACLEKFIAVSGAKSMLDAPCGDFNWMQTVDLPRGFRYFGADLVRDLVESHREKHGSGNRLFFRINLIIDPLPDVDLWLCRDCMFHLSLAHGLAVLENSLRSNIKYYMLTSHFNPVNADIESGQFRELNLCAAPFNLPEPIGSFQDYLPGFYPRRIGVWTRDQILGALVSRQQAAS